MWGAWGATGALAAAAGVSGSMTLGKMDALARERRSPDTDRAALDSAANGARGYAAATDVLAITALVTAGVALYFTLTAASPAPRPLASATNAWTMPGAFERRRVAETR
jgi:hypothetical protein